MLIRRVAVIFDDGPRPETTGVYCRRALSELVQVEHFRPANLDRLPPNAFDCCLFIDDGLRYPIPTGLGRTAYWAIDTHMDLEWACERGVQVDWLFAAQKDGTEQLRARGFSGATWLPLACDPTIHRKHDIPKRCDLTFIGTLTHGPRLDLIRLLQQAFPETLVGQRYFEEMAQAYSESRLVFNRSIRNDVNMRVLEGVACGSLLLTNDLTENGQSELLEPDRHLVTYQNAEELLDKARFYLSHEETRERIAECGASEAHTRHTYRHRMETILRAIEGNDRSIHAVSVNSASPARIAGELAPTWLYEIDFGIKTFLRPKALLRLLRSIDEYYPTAHVTIADDGDLQTSEDDDSRECCRLIDAHPGWTLHSLPFESGVVEGRNALIERTERSFLLILDDDFCFTEETRIERLFERLAKNEQFGVAAGACIDVLGGQRQVRNSGGTLEIDGDTLRIETQAWRDREQELREYVPQFALIRRAVFEKVKWRGGLGAEHYDFCLQLQRAGWRVAHDLTVRIDHHPFTDTLPGYRERRLDVDRHQQWLLNEWCLKQIVQDGQVIVTKNGDSTSPHVQNAGPSADHPSYKQDSWYYEFARPEVAELVPLTATKILDIGCGGGALGASIKARQTAHVTGIEFIPRAAAVARQRLDRVIEGSIEATDVDFPDGTFDSVICADVLEHLQEPGKILARISRWLTPGGMLVMSVPNARHHSVIRNLIDGNWTYEPAGLLDDTHLQFWTWRDLVRLLDRSGFRVTERKFVPGGEYADWVKAGRADEIREGALALSGLAPGQAEEFHAYQYLVRAVPRPHRKYGLTSIILVTHNQWEYTAACLASVRKHTDEPYELIVVDNASTDSTLEELKSRPDVTLIANATNRGFPAAVNQGIAAARGEQILLLNNDVLVTTGWLRRMLDVLSSAPDIGLVGPYTNCSSGSQRVGKTTYPLRELDDFAGRWAAVHAGRQRDTDELTAFCLLIRRALIERIGLLDERFGVGVYEDIDYCCRALHAGYRLAVAEEAYVHHFGHRSFHGAGLDQDQQAVTNQDVIREKWRGSVRPPENQMLPPPIAATATAVPTESYPPFSASIDEELLSLIPANAERILILGEPDEQLAKEVAARRKVQIVELTTLARNTAAVDVRVVQGDRWTGEQFDQRFDCVLWPRLSESSDPRPVLQKLRYWLSREGTLVASFPNAREQGTLASLIQGSWAPVASHELARPLRFFTRRELEKLFFRQRWELSNLIPVRRADSPVTDDQIERGEARLGLLSLMGIPIEQAAEFAVDRFVVQVKPLPLARECLTSIILVTYNEVRYTQRCLDSLRFRTDEPIEVIVVDNGSTDGTLDYLRSLDGVTVIANGKNRGFPVAANQGILAARGDSILLLNNDTLLTTGWLRRMLDVLDREPTVGLVGPCSNYCSGPQEVAVTYDRRDALDGFAWDWGKTYDQRTVATDRLVGFCLLFRREVVDSIGLLDEQFGIGNFEDDDFCRRALAVGFEARIARDAFIHHFGSRTFIGSGVDFAGILEENQKKYDAKWNGAAVPANGNCRIPALTQHSAPQAPSPIPRFSIKAASDGGLLLGPNTIKISLCMIVRDNETTIGPCLESIRPYVDEIVIVDTGSKDRTPEICRKYGARLYEFPWCDDFSAARNKSLKYARGEWLFWMDSDDTITADCGQKLRTLVDGAHQSNVLGYVMQVHCPGPGGGGHRDITVVDHVKLIRNRPDLRFEGRIHEQLLPAIRRAEGDVAWTDLYVVHSGSDHSPDGWQRKLERDLRILHRELAEQPDHPFVLFNLGMTYADAKRYDEAIEFLRKCLSVSRPEESHLRKAYAILISSLGQADRHDDAWKACQEGRQLYPDDKELLFREAMLHHHFRRLREAEQAYLQVLNAAEERHFTSVDQGLTGYKARHNLALVYEDMGDLDRAEVQWRRITDEVPKYVAAWRGLGNVLLRRNDIRAVEHQIERLLACGAPWHREGHLLRGRLAAIRGDIRSAAQEFEWADSEGADDLEPLQQLCRLYFENDKIDEAERWLGELTRRAPEDGAAFHNLGAVQYRRHDLQAAVASYRQSLTVRPDSNETWLQLGWALRDGGQLDEARMAWKEVLRREPQHAPASAALHSCSEHLSV